MLNSGRCTSVLSAQDVEFILQSLDPQGTQHHEIEQLLLDENSRNAVLDHPVILQNLLEHTGCIPVSLWLYFYVLSRHCLLQKGLLDPALSDYLGHLLCQYSRTLAFGKKSTDEGSRNLFPYVSDLLAEIKTNSALTSLRKRIELGDLMLFICGIFFDVIEKRRMQWAAPSMDFYESIGAAQYRIVAEDRLMRDSAKAQLFREMAEVFHELRLALNDMAERILHMHENSGQIILQA